MGGEVKPHLTSSSVVEPLTSGVRPQALLIRSRHLEPCRAVAGWGLPVDEVGCVVAVAAAARCCRDMEADVFSAACGNQTAIRAS
jgi:hypothetical protein